MNSSFFLWICEVIIPDNSLRKIRNNCKLGKILKLFLIFFFYFKTKNNKIQLSLTNLNMLKIFWDFLGWCAWINCFELNDFARMSLPIYIKCHRMVLRPKVGTKYQRERNLQWNRINWFNRISEVFWYFHLISVWIWCKSWNFARLTMCDLIVQNCKPLLTHFTAKCKWVRS